MPRKKYQPMIVNPVSVILHQGNIIGQFEVLAQQGKPISASNPFVEKDELSFFQTPEFLHFKKTYAKLERGLYGLEKNHQQSARVAATVLSEKLTAVCQYYNANQRQAMHLPKGRRFSDFVGDRATSHESSTLPSQLLKELEQEFKKALEPAAKTHLVTKIVVTASCAFIGAAVLMALCITATLFLPDLIPALKPIATTIATPLPHTGLLPSFSAFPLLTIGNTVSSGIGALLGGGLGFWATKKYENSYLTEFRECLKALKNFDKKFKEQHCDSDVKATDTAHSVFN